jgi:hypothetical protein
MTRILGSATVRAAMAGIGPENRAFSAPFPGLRGPDLAPEMAAFRRFLTTFITS